MEVMSEEACIVTNISCIPSQHLFLKYVVLKEILRRKAEEKPHHFHLTIVETLLLACLCN